MPQQIWHRQCCLLAGSIPQLYVQKTNVCILIYNFVEFEPTEIKTIQSESISGIFRYIFRKRLGLETHIAFYKTYILDPPNINNLDVNLF